MFTRGTPRNDLPNCPKRAVGRIPLASPDGRGREGTPAETLAPGLPGAIRLDELSANQPLREDLPNCPEGTVGRIPLTRPDGRGGGGNSAETPPPELHGRPYPTVSTRRLSASPLRRPEGEARRETLRGAGDGTVRKGASNCL